MTRPPYPYPGCTTNKEWMAAFKKAIKEYFEELAKAEVT